MENHNGLILDKDADIERDVYAEEMTEMVVDLLDYLIHHEEKTILLHVMDSTYFDDIGFVPDSGPKDEIWFTTFAEKTEYGFNKMYGYVNIDHKDFRDFLKMVMETGEWKESFDLSIGVSYKPWSADDAE